MTYYEQHTANKQAQNKRRPMPNISGLIRQLRTRNPTADKDELRELFKQALLQQRYGYLVEDCKTYTFDRFYVSAFRDKPQRRTSLVGAAVKRIRKLILMDVALPNGKKLRDATFADCGKAKGWFGRVEELGRSLGKEPTDIVGHSVTEAQLPKWRSNK